MSLEKMSDEELAALYDKEIAKPKLESMSDEELNALYDKEISSNKTVKEPTTNQYVEAARAGIQGATSGFSDEIAGGVEAAGRVFGLKGAGGPLKEMSLESPTLDPEILKAAYKEAKTKELSALKKGQEDYPITTGVSEFAGGFSSPINKLTKGMSLAKQAAVAGGAAGLGYSDAESIAGDLTGAAAGAALGGALGKGAEKITSLAGNKLSGYLGSQAEKLAEKATGATGKQAEKFAEGAGRELLDQGVVTFGATPEKIAAKSNVLIKQAERTIDSALKGLDEKGVQISIDDLVSGLEQKAAQMAEDPSNAPVVKKLRGMIDDIYEVGKSKINISDAEKIKRGYNKVAKNWLDPEQGQAGKVAYLAFRDAVENSAQIADPEMAKAFIGAKKVYGLMNPIREAAEKRASQLNQSPFGGLLDVAAAGGAGASVGGIEGLGAGLLAAGARRFVAPRLASSAAVATDIASKGIAKAEQNLSPYVANIVKNPSIYQSLANKAQQDKDIANVLTTMSPYDREQYIKKDSKLTPTQRAILLKQNRNAR